MKYLSNINLNLNEIQNVVIQNLNTVPITSSNGQIYYDTTISKLKLKTAGGWVTINTGGSSVGPGTINRISKFITTSNIGDSIMEDNGSSIIVTGDLYADSFYTNTGYALMDDGTAIVNIVQFGSTLSYLQYIGIGFNTWLLPNNSGTIALTSDITAATTLDAVLTNGNVSQIDAKVGGIYLYNTNAPSGNGYVYITGDKNRFNFYNNANVNYANIAQDTLTLIDSVVPTRQFQIKKPATIGATRTATFQDASGTVAYLSDIPTGNISGSGTINFLPKFTSSSGIGDSPHTTTSQVLTVNDSGRPFINSGTVRLSIQRAQSQIDFNCGNPGFNEPSSIISDNQTDGFEILSKGELALKTGATYTNEGLRLLSTGKLKFTQTPDTGTTSDFILLRDTSGNVKQIAGNTYVTTANATLQNAYDNSTNGKILLDLTRGGIKVQAITGTTRTIESYNVGATTPNFYVDPSGNPFGNYFYANWFNTPFGSGLEDNSGTVRLNSAYDGIAGQGRWESNQRINYLADYSALYSNRSLIDKGYADSTYLTSAVTSVGATSPITSSGGTTPVISTSMATNKLIGRSTAGIGVMEEISVGSGLSLSGGTLSSTAVANGIRSGITTGTDTYAVTIAGVTSYVVNDTYIIQFSNANTGAATLDINGLGPINLFKYNDVPVLSGDISAGHQFVVSFDGTNFELIGIRPNQLFAFITNDDSVTINKGQPVYAFGAAGNRMSVKLAANTADATSAKTLGLVFSSSIAPNQTGLIIIQGVIENINTAAFSSGDSLYLGPTAGSLTNVKPYAPNHLVYLGIVERANAGNGQIYVRTQNGYELEELHDVDLITNPPLNNNLLVYETSSGLWKNKSLAAIGGGTVTNVSAVMTNPSQTVAVTNSTTTPNITIDDTNLLYNKFMVNQYAYLFPSDGNTLWDTNRVGGTLLTTGTVSALSENPMGQLFQTALATSSVTGFFGTNFGATSYFGSNFEFDFSYRFRINTNNGAQRFFAGLSNMYGTATPTNIEPTNMINSVGVAKLQGSANLFFIWNDATGTASSLDLGSGFLGTDTTSTYRLRIYKQSLVPILFIELYKVTSSGVVTVTTNNISGDYNTGVNHHAAIWMGNNTAASGVVSFKNYGCQLLKRGLQNA